MTADEPDIIIQPRRPRDSSLLPQRALLVVNPTEAGVAVAAATERGAVRRRLHHGSLLVDSGNRFCLAGPALGAPAAGILAEQLIVHGVREIWLFSCCGSVDPAIGVESVFIPSLAIVGEGVSGWYNGHRRVAPDPETTRKIRQFVAARGMAWREGVIWSTDAPFRERRSTLLLLREQYGVSCVDMECSALCSVCAYRGARLGGLFVVSDELWTRRWKPGFGAKGFQERVRILLHALFDELSDLVSPEC